MQLVKTRAYRLLSFCGVVQRRILQSRECTRSHSQYQSARHNGRDESDAEERGYNASKNCRTSASTYGTSPRGGSMGSGRSTTWKRGRKGYLRKFLDARTSQDGAKWASHTPGVQSAVADGYLPYVTAGSYIDPLAHLVSLHPHLIIGHEHVTATNSRII